MKMGRQKKIYNFLWLGMTILWGCAKQPATSTELIIGMEKTSCYGPCPVYKIEIRNDRTMWYSGKNNVPVMGERSIKLTQEEYDKLRDEFIKAKFFEFNSSYTSHVPDYPTIYLEFNDGEKKKRVKDYYGAPKELKNLENKLEDLVRRRIWEN